MGTTRLLLYNDALLECAERKLGSLSENVPARRYLDQVWDAGFVDDVLSDGQWTFATRSVRLDAETNIDPQFGHIYAFAKPSDHIRTTALSSDEYFNSPLLQYQIDTNYWFASITPFYLRYVSNDANYGGDLSKWPSNFTSYARYYMANRVLPKLSGNKTDRAALEKRMHKAKVQAQSSDAMEEPTRFPPPGSLVRSRMRGRTGGGWDNGNRSRLIG